MCPEYAVTYLSGRTSDSTPYKHEDPLNAVWPEPEGRREETEEFVREKSHRQ
jgi:hypothetical protein